MDPQALFTEETAFVANESRLHEPRTARRIQHRCGRFLAEVRNGVLYVVCVRCKDLVPVHVDESTQELPVTHISCV